MLKKIFALLVITFIVSGCGPKAVKPGISSYDDAMTGIKLMVAGPFEINRVVQWDITKGREDDGGVAYIIQFRSNGALHGRGGWQFLDNHHLYILADGIRFDLGEGRHDGQVKRTYSGDVYVYETMTFSVDKDFINLLADSFTIKGRIGSLDFDVTEDQLDVIRKFNRESEVL